MVEQDGRLWQLILHDGLRFHDGEAVRARDVTASIRRFAARDAFGQALIGVTDDLLAIDDQTVQFRLKRPFPLLPAALGKAGPIMPERLALTDPHARVEEMVGSGPDRFMPAERVPGSLLACERFGSYVSRPNGSASFTAGPKQARFDRIEWHVIPAPDLLPLLRKRPEIRTEIPGPRRQPGMPVVQPAPSAKGDQKAAPSASVGRTDSLSGPAPGVAKSDASFPCRRGALRLHGARLARLDRLIIRRAICFNFV